MEIYKTKDKLVTKFIHDDGSETAIKRVSSCIKNKDNIVEPTFEDKNKFSVFVSTSVGCPIKCKFCFLTLKKYPYYKLTNEQILNNFKEAFTAEVINNQEYYKDRYLQLSWQGMGDPFLLSPRELVDLSLEMVLFSRPYCAGLDGVGASTVLPEHNNYTSYLSALNFLLGNFFTLNKNNNYIKRSAFRLFYSMHTPELIPRRKDKTVSDLKWLNEQFGINIIIHHLLFNNINDSKEDIDTLITNIKTYCPNAQLRILRYNKCSNSPYGESTKFNEIVTYLYNNLPDVKYQVSLGSEIKASWGQFIMREL